MDRYQALRDAITKLDDVAQEYGWASDQGTRTRLARVETRYETAKSSVNTAIQALLAERDALREALTEAARVIALDRQSLIQCHENPKTGEIEDGLGREGLREYDHALELARAALSQ